MSKYKPKDIEAKWQKKWETESVYKTPEAPSNKKYILDMYPYPSGDTLHVGHTEGYVGTDILARYARMNGYDVLHPMGWDSFGLPAENYAIKTGIHPEESTNKNIQNFKRQLSSIGMNYDWDNELTSSDPDYYKWNQWLFIQLFKKGMAYKAGAKVNWCTSCETVLANEQVEDGKCERCDAKVELKMLDQWFLSITAYADRLIEGLENIDWLDEVKTQQKNWIGRSYGAEIIFKIQKIGTELTVFTTRPDTLHGATFLVVSPEHEFSKNINTPEVIKYISEAEKKSEEDRIAGINNKTGVFSGFYALNPANGEEIPIWIADYVLSSYGTGAIMAVPAHDERDLAFAKKYKLNVVEVFPGGNIDKNMLAKEGVMVNSGDWNGLKMPVDMPTIIESIEKNGWGNKKTTYHIRDWLISRQRYWGTPIPMIYCQSCASADKNEAHASVKLEKIGGRADMPGWYCVPENELPLVLPKDIEFNSKSSFRKNNKGRSPLAMSQEFQKDVKCPACGQVAKREVDTMDGFVDSSWYFIRFTDPKNTKEFASFEAMNRWLPVDVYVGGGHVVQHLLYSRFFWKFMMDAGFIDKSLGEEPFLKLRAPGWILGSDSRKMSKRWGNVVTPDDIIPKYGADTLRMYEMFMGPFEAMKPWSLAGVEGMSRFLNRVWKLVNDHFDADFKPEHSQKMDALMHKSIKRVEEDLNNMHYNRAIAGIMEFVNGLNDMVAQWKEGDSSFVKINEWHNSLKNLLLLMAPFAPHMTEELWQKYFGGDKKFISIHQQKWPKYDEQKTIESSVNIPVQVNGKLRGSIFMDTNNAGNQEMVENKAKIIDSVIRHLEGKSIQKIIFVKGKLINFVVS